jgi:hypothetical protein
MLRAVVARRALCRRLSTFYDSQSGTHVDVPTGVQCHVGFGRVAIDRTGAALKHLIRDGRPIKGIASVLHPVATQVDEVGALVRAAESSGVCVHVSDVADGVAAVRAAHEQGLSARALLSPELCVDADDVALHAAHLGDAGAEVVFLSVRPDLDSDDLREMADRACEVDLVGVPMRARLGLRIEPGPEALKLAKVAHEEFGLLHFHACLGGKESSRPSDLLPALGFRKPDFNFGSLVLAEHVPDAA